MQAPWGLYWGNIGIMENKMETIIMENQMEKKMENEMETGIILGLCWDNGKENGNPTRLAGGAFASSPDPGNPGTSRRV